MNSGIYKITYLPTGQKYVGQAINIEERWGYHRTRKTNNLMDKLLQDESTDIRDFCFEILETTDKYTIEWADEKEIYWIKKENSYYYDNPKYGCNLTRGGSLGWKEMSRVRTKGVEQLTLDNQVIGIFSSRAEAQRMTGVEAQSISKVISKKRKTAGGYFWRNIGSNEIYTDEPLSHAFSQNHPSEIDVYLVETEEFIATYPTSTQAGRALNVNDGDIRRTCVGERISCKGYYFRYHGDSLNKFPLKKNKKVVTSTVKRQLRPINQYNTQGNLIKKYESISQAIKENPELNKSTLITHINKNKVYKGYYWKDIERGDDLSD